MTEKIQPIRTLDELSLGDVVNFGCYLNFGIPHVVDAIAEIPEHEKEVLLQVLHRPYAEEGDKKDPDIEYEPRTLIESELRTREVTKLNKDDYKGWRYLSMQRVV